MSLSGIKQNKSLDPHVTVRIRKNKGQDPHVTVRNKNRRKAQTLMSLDRKDE